MRLVLVVSMFLAACSFNAHAARAGTVTLLTGSGTASTPDGQIRKLTKGGAVNSGELINSGSNSYINLKFKDGGFILLRPNSRFEIERFDYEGEDLSAPSRKPADKPPATGKPEKETAQDRTRGDADSASSDTGKAFFRLLKGGFRAVTGLVGKTDRNNYRVATPVATIGIRGTDYVVVLCDAACSADPVISSSLPGGAAVNGGAVVGVISGGVFVQNNVGAGTALGADQYLVQLPDGTQVELPFQPRFLRVDPIPNPESCQ